MSIGIDYNESTQPAKFELKTKENSFSLAVKAPVGEILQPVLLSEGEFIAAQSNYLLCILNIKEKLFSLLPGYMFTLMY